MIWHRQRIADYVRMCVQLVWQRQAMLFGGFLITAVYFDLRIALLCYTMCLLAELHDVRVCREASDWDSHDGLHPANHVARLSRSAMLSAGTIAFSMVIVSVFSGPGLHLGPLVFLFCAALYAAMNTCQLTPALRIRIHTYRAAMLFIPLWDLAQVRPPLHSPLWMQLATVLFMLFMLQECARYFAANYRNIRGRLTGLREERDAVAEAYKVQSQFVSVVSHELRTPLTSIKASLDMISDEEMAMSAQDMRKVAAIGQRNGNRLAMLIDDLLDFQKLSAGMMEFNMRRLDLNALVREVVESNRALGAERDITVAVYPAQAPVQVTGDVGRLQQVVLNVLSNAVKFSENGQTVDVSVTLADGRGCVLIRDRGVGIPEGAQDQVFAPFAQVDASDKRAFGGTGLGMSISRRIMESHGGTISYRSQPGAGTTFTIGLDLAPVQEPAANPGAATLPGAVAVSA